MLRVNRYNIIVYIENGLALPEWIQMDGGEYKIFWVRPAEIFIHLPDFWVKCNYSVVHCFTAFGKLPMTGWIRLTCIAHSWRL